MTLLDFVRLVRHNAWLLAASILAGLLGGAVFSLLQPTLYQATSSGYVVAGASETVGESTASTSLAERKALQYKPLVDSKNVREAIAADLAGEYPQGVRLADLKATTIEGATLYRVTASAPTAEEAQAIANSAMKVISDEALKLESIQTDGTSSGKSIIRLVPTEEAALPTQPYSPTWLRNLPIGAAVGLALGFVIAFVRRSIDGRIRTQEDLDEVTGSAVLGIIPKSEVLETSDGSEVSDNEATGEALRHLRTNLRFVSVDNPPRSIVVTSANPSEGKSTIAAALARLLAEAGQPTILVDADLRRPRQAARFGLESGVGLSQVLAGDLSVDAGLQDTAQDHLQLLAAGRIPPNPSELVGSQRMRSLIEKLGTDHTVIIDAPPILPVTDAGLLTAAADGAILVTRVGSTQKEQVRQSVKLLKQVNGTLLGSVLNQTPKRQMGSATYGYGYGGYASDYKADPTRLEGDTAGKPRRGLRSAK